MNQREQIAALLSEAKKNRNQAIIRRDRMVHEYHHGEVQILNKVLAILDEEQTNTEALEEEIAELRCSLRMLIDVKDHKDRNGKDTWYQEAQPMAWQEARRLLTNPTNKDE